MVGGSSCFSKLILWKVVHFPNILGKYIYLVAVEVIKKKVIT